MLEPLKERVCRLHKEMLQLGLVTMTSGNVSARDPASGRIVIRPSGVPHEKLTQASMLVISLEGELIEGRQRPSLDMVTHLYIYRQRPEVGGIAHTHSPYATAFAAAGRALPAALTTMAERFGGPIPVGGYATTEGEEIGKEVIHSIGESRAILMRQHGVYAIGKTPEAAFRMAMMVEEAARTCFLGLQLGALSEIPPQEVERLHRRYLQESDKQEE
jgi:L-ribulose-5-phosphate 4-epimerase